MAESVTDKKYPELVGEAMAACSNPAEHTLVQSGLTAATILALTTQAAVVGKILTGVANTPTQRNIAGGTIVLSGASQMSADLDRMISKLTDSIVSASDDACVKNIITREIKGQKSR